MLGLPPSSPAAQWAARRAIPLAVTLLFLMRMTALGRPLRPDEAGVLLVARSWTPSADSVYGQYFVDRPPILVWLVKLSDDLLGASGARIVGAVACVALVLLTAAIARLVAGRRAARWSAVAVAALLATPLIDVVAVKGELLGLPFALAACWLTLLATRRTTPAPAALLAFAAGISAMTAIGVKQNLAGGLVFSAVLLVGLVVSRGLSRGRFVTLVGAGALGAAVPVLAVVLWARTSGIDLSTLWYVVVDFRSEASTVLSETSSDANRARAVRLVGVATLSGLLLILVTYAASVGRQRLRSEPVAWAVLALIVFDLFAVVIGGSYWVDYLFTLVPGAGLALALLLGPDPAPASTDRPARLPRVLVAVTVVSALVTYPVWIAIDATGNKHFKERDAGRAIGAAAQPGDTLVVFGGRADVQFAADLPSPYTHLWTLPMRTMDPDYADLVDLVSGPQAPTWFVEWVPFTSWQAPGAAALQAAVEENYSLHGRCGDRPIFLRHPETRPSLELVCPA